MDLKNMTFWQSVRYFFVEVVFNPMRMDWNKIMFYYTMWGVFTFIGNIYQGIDAVAYQMGRSSLCLLALLILVCLKSWLDPLRK